MAIQVIRGGDRHFSDFDWLKTYWLFSFADYYDPENVQFGALRVFNDDVVKPGMGLPAHTHREMEIITVVLEGEITHEDSMGNKGVIRKNDVQRMSAGTGLTHSEFNLADRPVHFYQIWIYPDIKGSQPSYDQRSYDTASWKNRLTPVASGQDIPDVVTLHADATIYRGQLDKGRSVEGFGEELRRIFLYVTSGALSIEGEKVLREDQARIDVDTRMTITAIEDSDFIIVDVPSCRGLGYDSNTLAGSRSN